MAPSPKPGIMEIKPYVGGKGARDDGANIAKLSANENALGASPKAIAAYQSAAHGLHRYPEGGAHDLRQAIAARNSINPDHIVCGAGSDELISLLTKAYAGPGDEVLYSAHGFLMYRLSALAAGAHPVSAPEQNLRADVKAMLARVSSRTKIVFIANPNNPTGSYLTKAEIAELRAGLPEATLLVIDGAYAEFVGLPDYDDGLAMAQALPNVAATRTFSKIHGLAALRLGWMVAQPHIVDVINRVRGPFNVGVPAQLAGIAAIQDQEHVAKSKAHNDRWLNALSASIEALGLKVYPSVGNFVLIEFSDKPDAPVAAVAKFMEERGVIPREVAAYGLPHCLRVSIGSDAECRLVIDSLGEWLAR